MGRDAAFRNRKIRDALCRAIYRSMQLDPRIYMLGEGASMKVHYDAPAIENDFAGRIVTLPISEGSNTDFSVGCAIGGMVPVVDVISGDFLWRTMDAICNTAAKHADVAGPRTIVIRAEHLTGGPTTGQRFESIFARIPGLSVVVPSNPYDAEGLMLQALRHRGVTVFFEDREIEDATTPENVDVPCALPIRYAAYVRQAACDPPAATVVSYGLGYRRLVVDERFDNCDLVDLRTLWPLDMIAIGKSTERTGQLLVVEPACDFAGIGSEIVAQSGVSNARNIGAPRKTLPVNRDQLANVWPTADDAYRALMEMT